MTAHGDMGKEEEAEGEETEDKFWFDQKMLQRCHVAPRSVAATRKERVQIKCGRQARCSGHRTTQDRQRVVMASPERHCYIYRVFAAQHVLSNLCEAKVSKTTPNQIRTEQNENISIQNQQIYDI